MHYCCVKRLMYCIYLHYTEVELLSGLCTCAHTKMHTKISACMYIYTCAVFAEGRRGGVKGVLSVGKTHGEVGGGS